MLLRLSLAVGRPPRIDCAATFRPLTVSASGYRGSATRNGGPSSGRLADGRGVLWRGCISSSPVECLGWLRFVLVFRFSLRTAPESGAVTWHVQHWDLGPLCWGIGKEMGKGMLICLSVCCSVKPMAPHNGVRHVFLCFDMVRACWDP